MVDGRAVDTTVGVDGKATYVVQVAHDEAVNASFAQLASDVRMLDPDTTAAIASIAADGSRITFSAATSLLQSLAVNDVLVNGTSWQKTTPLMVRVTAIDRSGGQTVVTTKPATLLDVLSSASVELDEPIRQAAQPPVGERGGGLIEMGPPAVGAADDVALDFPVEADWNDKEGRSVTAKAKVSIGVPRVQIAVSIGLNGVLPVVHEFRATVSENVGVTGSIEATKGAELSKTWSSGVHDFEVICPLPFVCVFPQLEVGVHASVGYSADLSLSASADATFTTGVQWKDGWSLILPTLPPHPADVKVTAGVEGTATVYPFIKATASIDGLCGPYVELRPGQLDLTADLSAEPHLQLDASVVVAAGAQCIFGDPYEMASAPLFSTQIWTGAITGPVSAQAPTPEPLQAPSGTFSTNSPTIFGAQYTATSLKDGRVLLAGLGNGAGIPNQAEIYDPKTGQFTQPDQMMIERANATATLLPDGQVLIAGGCQCSGAIGKYVDSAELFDPRAATFSWAGGAMTTSRSGHSATLLNNGLVLIAGGVSNSGGVLASAELYNPTSGTFSPTGSMTTARLNQTATLLQDGRVLIIGGKNSYGEVLSAELYDPMSGQFTPTTNSPGGKLEFHTATPLGDGRVLIAGGEDGSTALASAEVFDPGTARFSPSGSMASPRVGHTATLLSSGKVLIAGGYDGGRALASAELYDPVTGTFSPTGSMITARTDHTATSLAGGGVLIYGGDDGHVSWGSATPVNSSELYDTSTGTFSETH
jgi:hypothetical protein